MTNDRVETRNTELIELCSDGVYVVGKTGERTKIADPINVTAYATSRPDGLDHRIIEVMTRDGRTRLEGPARQRAPALLAQPGAVRR